MSASKDCVMEGPISRAKLIFQMSQNSYFEFGAFSTSFDQLEIEQFVERSAGIEVKDWIWRVQFEDRSWRKASLFGVGRGAQVGNLHLVVNFGASVEVGRICFDTRQAPGCKQKYPPDSGLVLCHQNACGLDVWLWSSIYLNIDLNPTLLQ